MEETVWIACPFCGQPFELMLDLSIQSQQLTTDCEVCCRPMEVLVDTRGGELIRLQVN